MATQKTKRVSDMEARPEGGSAESSRPSSNAKHGKRKAVIAMMAVVLIGVVYVGGYKLLKGYYPWASEEAIAQVEVENVLEEVSSKMLLPDGEPVFATVNDAELLKSQQPFFQKAIDGDQLLIFPESAQAVLYSPSRGVIVNVGPLQYGQEAAADAVDSTAGTIDTTPSTTTETPAINEVSVEVRNGSGVNGLGSQTANALASIVGVTVPTVTDAANDDYSETIVVTNSNTTGVQQMAQVVAQNLGAQVVTTSPVGEVASSADILVVIGQ